MNLGLKIAAAWIGATLIAVVIASAAVGSVRSQVTDDALPLGSPDVAALSVDVTAASDTTMPSSTLVPTTTRANSSGAGTSTTVGPATTTTSSTLPPNGATSTSTTSTAPATTTSTTTAPSTSYSRTFDTAGGSVRVVVNGNNVTFGGAVPKTGGSVELKDPGPKEVKVEFEQNGGEGDVEFTATIENGELKVEISGGGDDH